MRVFLAAVLTLAVAIPAGAEHCFDDAKPEITTPATGLSYQTLAMGGPDDNPGVYYVDNDLCQPGCFYSVWIYEETNGIPGLQRGDEVQEWCLPDEPDTILF